MDLLKKVLKDADIKQYELAEKLNVKSLSTINLMLNGKAEISTEEAKIIKNLINEKLHTNYTIEELFE